MIPTCEQFGLLIISKNAVLFAGLDEISTKSINYNLK